MTEAEVINIILGALPIMGIGWFGFQIIKEEQQNKLERAYGYSNRVYIKNNFPIEELRGLECKVSSYGIRDKRVEVEPIEQEGHDLIEKYRLELRTDAIISGGCFITNNSGYDQTYYVGDEVPKKTNRFAVRMNYKFFSLTQELPLPDKKVVKKKKKGYRMSRIHRFWINTAVVFGVWKLVMNAEQIIKYLIELF